MDVNHTIDGVLHTAALTLDDDRDHDLNQPTIAQTWGELKEHMRRRRQEKRTSLTPYKTELDITKDSRSK